MPTTLCDSMSHRLPDFQSRHAQGSSTSEHGRSDNFRVPGHHPSLPVPTLDGNLVSYWVLHDGVSRSPLVVETGSTFCLRQAAMKGSCNKSQPRLSQGHCGRVLRFRGFGADVQRGFPGARKQPAQRSKEGGQNERAKTHESWGTWGEGREGEELK